MHEVRRHEWLGKLDVRENGKEACRTLADPRAFIEVLQQHASNQVIFSLLHRTAISRKDWVDHLHVVSRHVKTKRSSAEQDPDWALVKGGAAEFAMPRIIHHVLDTHADPPSNDVTLKRWSRNEEPIQLGGEYSVKGLYPYNALLVRKRDGEVMQEEYDMTVWSGRQALHLLDVTISNSYMREKLQDKERADRFDLFRRRMQELFHETDGESGIANISKIHILCYEEGRDDPCRDIISENDGTYAVAIPCRTEIAHLSGRTIKALRKLGVVKERKDERSRNS